MKGFLYLSLAITSIAVTNFAQPAAKPAKLSAEEIITRHLASIGPSEARSKITSRVFVGDGRLNGKKGFVGNLSGPAQLASDGRKVLLAMVLNGADYSYEKVGFNGKDLTVGKPDGRFTMLAEFLRSQTSIVKDGLFTGTLSSAWPFLGPDGKQPKFETAGIDEIGGRWFYKLKYSRGELLTTLFFDAVDFRHHASKYEYTIDPRMTTSSTDTPKEKPSRFTMTEQFSDFRTFGDLTLPAKYSIDITNELDGDVTQMQWSVQVLKAYYNQALEEAVFRVS